jgi:hypothetical protein
MHALKSKLKVLDLDVIPDEVIKKIVSEVKKQYELSSKEQIRESFNKIKKEMRNISTGLSDKEFFNIVNKYAQPFVPAEFKPKNKKKSDK